MTMQHAVVWTDHHKAQVLQFDAEHVLAQKIKTHTHHTRQHGSAVRSEHEFFADLCDALKGIEEVLVTGPRTALADFRHYLDKHRPEVGKRVVGTEPVDHPSDGQLVAFARQYFAKYDLMQGKR
jgi:stalled ribosome rescue protein Dom34